MPEERPTSPISVDGEESAAIVVLAAALRAGEGGPIDGSGPVLAGGDIERADPGRVRGLLDRILVSPAPDVSFAYLRLAGFVACAMPELHALLDLSDGGGEHKDLWEHTLRVTAQAPPALRVRWAALLHDIGKARTRRTDERGEVHFLGHEAVGARMALRLLRRLGYPEEEARRIRFLVANHQRCNQYDGDWTDSAVRRLGKELGDGTGELIELSRADVTTKRQKLRERYHLLLEELAARLERIREEDARLPLLPSGIGDAIMAAMGIGPGPRVGKLKAALEAAVEAGELEPRREPEYYIDYLRRTGRNVDVD